MFESLFPEAVQRRAQQAALDTYKATLEYQQVRRDNPTMLEQNFVDFSNPESVARMQAPILNPYGYNNPYSNPNLMMQNYGYNPSLYMNGSYGGYGWGGTWYGGGWGGGYDKRFMTPDKDDKMIPIGAISKGTPSPRTRRKTLKEKKESKFVVVLKKVQAQPKPQEPQQEHQQFKTIKSKPAYHPPGVPYTFEELNPDYHQLKMIADTPLVWTLKDDEELNRLVEDLAVYDKAMAHVAYNIPIFEGCTREDYNYFKIYFNARINDFRSKELMNSTCDYRAKYRYRQLPPTTIIDGVSMPDLQKPVPVPIKSISLSGEVTYDYDRGRDELTEEEWDIFVDRAYGEMLKGAEQLKAEDLMRFNQHLASQDQQKPKENETKYNPWDPISRKLYQMKNEQKSYTTNMDFFKHVFRNQLTAEQFDNWWYGTRTNALRYSGRQIDPNTAQKLWAKQMADSNYQTVLQIRTIDTEMMKEWFNRTALAAINGYTKGTTPSDISLADYMRNLRYLDTRNHELNLEYQQKANQQAMWNSMSHDTFNKSLYQYMSSPMYSNPNPYYTPQYGTIDPRYGVPNQLIDLTNNDLAKQKKEIFLEHCRTTKGNVPLSPIYK